MKRPVDTYDAYRALIAGKCLTNNGYFGADVRRYIAQGSVSFLDAGAALFLFFREADYEQVVIYAEDSLPADGAACRPLLACQGELPWVSNVVFRSAEDSGAQRLSACLEQLGFRAEYINHEYALPDPTPCHPLLKAGGPQIRRATESCADSIQSLWRSALPAFVFSALDQTDMASRMASGRVLMATDSAAALCGALSYDVALGKTTAHHLVVAPEHRGQGVGALLIDAWLSEAQGARLALAWIEENNLASASLFRKFGFRRTGKVSRQYVRRRLRAEG